MKKLLFTLLLVNTLTVTADGMQLNISQEQIDKLDIQIAPISVSRLIPKLYAPAKVVIPANHERLISSTQPGVVVQLLANIGDSVEKGQVLAKINSPELVTLQREFLTAGGEFNLADLEYKRDKNLLEEGVIADRRWQETQSKQSSKSVQLDTARQLLNMAGMSPKEIQGLAETRQLSSVLNIHAAISGIVLERLTTVGTRLDIQAPLYRIADLSELWLEINIPQERLNSIHINDLVNIEDTTSTAKISLLGQNVNRENQTILARAIINKNQNQLRAGQNVNVQILQQSSEAGFQVNNTAIAQNNGHYYIFVRNTGGFLVTEVQILGKQDSESLIRAPLSGHEQIAAKGAVALKAVWLKLGEE